MSVHLILGNQMSKVCIFTIVSRNYLHYARTLMASVNEHYQDAKLIVVCCDVEGGFETEKEVFEVVNMAHLGIDDFAEFVFRYNILELNTAVKPFAFSKFLAEGFENVIYFDPDIRIFNSLDDMVSLISKHTMVLTPHLTGELDDGKRPNEIDILRAGTYNLGYIGVNNTPEALKFIDWWKRRLRTLCVNDLSRGLFVDQKWMELAPSLFKDVHINRAPDWNTAYWNLNHRIVSKTDNNRFLVNGKPLTFFHYSGFKHKDNILSIHQNRFDFKTSSSEVLELFHLYSSELFDNDFDNVSEIQYGYGSYKDGSSIANILRETYLSLEDNLTESIQFSLDAPSNSLIKLMNKAAISSTGEQSAYVTVLGHNIYKSRPDLQAAFPNLFTSDGRAFAGWYIASAEKEYGLSPSFTKSVLQEIELNDATNESPKNNIGLGRSLFLKLHKNPAMLRMADLIPGKYLRSKLKRKLIGQNIEITKPIVDKTKPKTRISNAGVNIIGYLHAESGTGEAARSTIRACNAVGLAVNGIDVRHNNVSRMEEKPEVDVSNKAEHDINIFHINADQTPEVFNSLSKPVHHDKYNIGFWFWELEELPDDYLASYSYLDEIWVASKFCQDAISKRSNIPVTLIPLCVDLNTSNLLSRSDLGVPEDSFLILSSIDMLSIPERKNPFAVLKTFEKLHSIDKNAHLVLKLSNLERCEKNTRDKIQAHIERLPVTLIDRYLERSELTSLMSTSDCYLSMHRSEGFGLPLAEAMQLKIPVVATGWSSNTDFMTINNSYLIKYDLVELKKAHGPYPKGAKWAEPDVSHAVTCILDIIKDPTSARVKTARALSDINEYNSPLNVGKRILSRIDAISQQP